MASQSPRNGAVIESRKMKPEERHGCNYENVGSHCPKTCGFCDQFKCLDSKRDWFPRTKKHKDKVRRCHWVGSHLERENVAKDGG
jgi:hypothetical protein